MIAYEKLLDSDPMAALREGSMHFERESAVHKTLLRIAGKLNELGIPYAIAGGMALFFHGYRRFTEDVDILISHEGLKKVHDALEGLGYIAPFEGSKNLRDAETGVRVEFLIEGDYPGDGKPKPIAFPDPSAVNTEIDNVAFLNLEKLIELKIASGMAPGRRKDLADVQELIRLLHLPAEFGRKLNPYVQPLFQQLWDETQQTPPAP
jgi:hypothetical protein